MRKYTIYFHGSENQGDVFITCTRIEMRDGFFECLKGKRPIAFYDCRLVRGIDSNPA